MRHNREMPSQISKAKKKSAAAPTFYDFVHACIADTALASRLLHEDSQWIERQSSLGETPLHYLAVENHVDAVRFLIEHGANVNTQITGCETPLVHAAQSGYPKMVALLIENGADLEAKSLNDATALLLAAQNGYVDICDLLLAAGANVTARDFQDLSVWDLAMPRKATLLFEVLAKHGIQQDENE